MYLKKEHLPLSIRTDSSEDPVNYLHDIVSCHSPDCYYVLSLSYILIPDIQERLPETQQCINKSKYMAEIITV